MGRNWFDALCKKCKKPMKVLIGTSQVCEECREKENSKSA